MPPSSGSNSYLLRLPLGISMMQIRAFVSTSVHLAAGHCEAGFAPRPRRIPRVAGDVSAAQRGIGILLGDEVAQLLEPALALPRRVQTVGVHIWHTSWRTGVWRHARSIVVTELPFHRQMVTHRAHRETGMPPCAG